MTPVRAQRELHHLYRLRDGQTTRKRLARFRRGVVAFLASAWIAFKFALAKSLAAKLAIAAGIGTLVAFPSLFIMLWTVLAILLLIISLVTCFLGETVDTSADCPNPNDCEWRN